MNKTRLFPAVALLGAIGIALTQLSAQAQQANWSVAEQSTYDSACGEPENQECYSQPNTSLNAPGGRYGLVIYCSNVLALNGARGGDGDLQFTSVSLAVDGQPQGQFQIGGGFDADYLNPEAGPGLIAALRTGTTLTMVFDGVTVSNLNLLGAGPALDGLDRACAAPAKTAEPTDVAEGPVEISQREYFADYMATCRTDGGCDGATFTETPTSDGQTFWASLTLNRAGFPGTAWMLSFSGAFEGPVPGTPIEVVIGRETWALTAGDGYGDIMGHNIFYWPVNEQILDAMRAGVAMDITQTISNGSRQTVRYSLRGLTATMAWIDQKQGRTGEPMMIGTPGSLEEIIPGYQP